MQNIQLYIENQRMDMFKDESVSLTQTIQNVRDIGKIFTNFTKTFSLPASKDNNKIFKHYYDFNITTGFDARTKKSATIELNYLPFEKGKIKLEGVDMRDNKPYAYRVTFFGNTVDLKDVIGEDKLDALSWLDDNFTIDYSNTEVRLRLQNGYDKTVDSITYTDSIITPLISHSQRLYYDSSTHVANTPNLAYHTGSGTHHHGVLWSDLKYAIRVHVIIKAIEATYPSLSFSTDFFNTSNTRYHNLYLWMQRKKGNLIQDDQEFTSQVTDFSITISPVYVSTTPINNVIVVERKITNISLTTVMSDASILYDVLIYRDGALLTSIVGISGDQSSLDITFTGSIEDGDLTVFVRGTESVTFNTFTLGFVDITPSSPTEQTIDAAIAEITEVIQFNPTKNVPEIKVIDFLTGLFKLFNLTAFTEDDGTIKVQTLDNFYASGTNFTIDEYVDMSEKQVNVALPYKEISFKFKGTKSLLASVFNQLTNREWGSIEYNNNEALDGGTYKVEVPFEHMQFERLPDGTGGTPQNVQVGYMIDENEQPIKGEPLLFYSIYNNSSPRSISFLTDASNKVEIPETGYTGYYIPSNSVSLSASTDDTVLHFGLETNEWSPSENFDGTLFDDLYKNYIQDVFNSKRRLIKLKAFLPLKILRTYTLADKFVLGNQEYRINSITTNLGTGESDIELLNIV
tara:strand:- start:3134 stop:5191 length:2058 start_codon:yes stop_codon:yes gene_type:complete